METRDYSITVKVMVLQHPVLVIWKMPQSNPPNLGEAGVEQKMTGSA